MGNSDRYRRDERYGRDDRGFVDRAADEVRSWFGDDAAEARRRPEDRDDARGPYRGAPPQDGAWAGRRDDWDRGDDRRRTENYVGDHRESRGWGATRAPWPEARGETTPQHGPVGSWREWRGQPPAYGNDGGWHVGKGPSGYTRSDERIREDVCDRLTDDPYVDATHIDVTVQGGEVTLGGSVDRREDKRRAEDIAERVSGVREVNNRLRVGIAQGSGSGAGTTTTPTRA